MFVQGNLGDACVFLEPEIVRLVGSDVILAYRKNRSTRMIDLNYSAPKSV